MILSLARILFITGLVGACTPVSAQVKEVVVVFKTHFDIGYTDFASNVVAKYRSSMIDQALGVCAAARQLPPERQFAWTLSGWPMSQILWPGQTAERRQRVAEAVREGRLVWHALPFTTHTETLELEDLVRGLNFSSSLSLQFGQPLPRDAKMTDVPCHSWILPTLLKHAGVDFLHLGCNAASASPEVPPLFWWESPDGSRLLTMYTAESYGTGLVPPKNWPYRAWLALIHTGDNHGPPTSDEITQLLAEAKQRLPGIKVRIGRLSDFADAILAERSSIPVVRGDMPDTWIHGPMSDPMGARQARHTRPRLQATEFLNTLLKNWQVDVPDLSGTLAAAYEKSLLYGEHTWGGALYWVTAYGKGTKWGYGDAWQSDRTQGRFRRLEDSWDEHTAYIQAARALSDSALETNLQALAQAVKVTGPRIVVFNPLPWKRDGEVCVGPWNGSITAVRSTRQSENIPVFIENDKLRFIARDLPPMGYRTYVPSGNPRSASSVMLKVLTNKLESPFFKLTIDLAKGVVGSLLDKTSGREWIDAKAEHSLGEYLYERFDSNQVRAYVDAYVKINADWAINELGKPSMPSALEQPYRASAAQNRWLRVEQNPLFATAVMESPASKTLAHRVTTRFILYQELPCLDIEVTLHDKPADAWPEAGWICLPFKIEHPEFRLGRLGSVIDPVKDIVPGSNHDLFWLNSGLTVTDRRGRGIGICPLDSPLISLDRPGIWRYSKTFVPRRPAVFMNLFNNQWTTNFRLWNQGTLTSRIRLWAVHHKDQGLALVSPAWEARAGLLAAMADGDPGPLPDTRSGVELSREGVLVTAFSSGIDGRGTLLRLWEQSGRGGRCQVVLPPEMKAAIAQPCDLRGQPHGEPLKIAQGKFTVRLRPLAPASFLLQPE